ncbi:hypothetical protein [Enhygromyxa salina]|uniref:hypothetical protein n=1 Tax=Enhygromyxa salina TaxID=215803 RepID=UPI000D08797C|nr:hypothetical protein [Enhygromyxa salina]
MGDEGDVGGEGDEGGGQARDWSALSLAAGLFSVAWAVAIVLPSAPNLPAWPAASVGILALVFSRAPGRPLLRAIGAFLGLGGVLVGLGKILALWGLLELLS